MTELLNHRPEERAEIAKELGAVLQAVADMQSAVNYGTLTRESYTDFDTLARITLHAAWKLALPFQACPDISQKAADEFAPGGAKRAVVEEYWRDVETCLNELATFGLWGDTEELGFAAGFARGKGFDLADADEFARYVVYNWAIRKGEHERKRWTVRRHVRDGMAAKLSGEFAVNELDHRGIPTGRTAVAWKVDAADWSKMPAWLASVARFPDPSGSVVVIPFAGGGVGPFRGGGLSAFSGEVIYKYDDPDHRPGACGGIYHVKESAFWDGFALYLPTPKPGTLEELPPSK